MDWKEFTRGDLSEIKLRIEKLENLPNEIDEMLKFSIFNHSILYWFLNSTNHQKFYIEKILNSWILNPNIQLLNQLRWLDYVAVFFYPCFIHFLRIKIGLLINYWILYVIYQKILKFYCWMLCQKWMRIKKYIKNYQVNLVRLSFNHLQMI